MKRAHEYEQSDHEDVDSWTANRELGFINLKIFASIQCEISSHANENANHKRHCKQERAFHTTVPLQKNLLRRELLAITLVNDEINDEEQEPEQDHRTTAQPYVIC